MEKEKNVYKIKVTAAAKTTKIQKILADGTLKISVKEPPRHGQANQAVLKLLSQYLKVPVTCLKIARGKNSSQKIIKIDHGKN